MVTFTVIIVLYDLLSHPPANLHCCIKTRSSLAILNLKRKVFTLFVVWAIVCG